VPTVGEAFAQARQFAAAGQLHEAELIYRQLAAALPGAAEVWGQMGIFFLEARRPDAAVEPLVKATQLDPANGAYHGALGAAYRLLKRRTEAIASFARALAIGPRSPALLNNLALAQKDAGQYEAAMATFDAALAMQPDFQSGHFNRGNLLLAQWRMDEAVAAFHRAIELDPSDAGAYCSLGMAHYDRAEFVEAMAAFDQALRLQPKYPEAQRNRALLLLLQGNYAQGWPAFEARLDCDDFPQHGFRQPRWDGTPLAGRRLHVYAEQGLGDALQFVRYLPLAARTAARVTYAPHDVLRPVLERSGFGPYLVPVDRVPDFDVHASLLSLAGFLPDSSGRPYWPGPYLHADAALSAQWAQRLRGVGSCKVGIAWAGSPEHSHDRWRSTRLANFAPLAAIPGVRLISLQQGAGREQLAEVAGEFEVLDLDPEMDVATGAFVDRAGVIEHLDLVITVDTALAHLAGGLGKPVWLALQFIPDWRWGLRGESTPWYPTMRLFRQRTFDDWQDVFARMAEALRRLSTMQLRP
jgi:tetratricopeptide (TPR) repeat protein